MFKRISEFRIRIQAGSIAKKAKKICINAALPITMGKMDAFEKGDDSVIEMDEKAFG